ncbi:protein disulfide-isomerase A3-like [Atheta coriaria]|uniref:protein disulfide-isomerase A3-like n=1 Tax=Dalotia coriaria TaxID=877792 RepID=UPI0031F355EA
MAAIARTSNQVYRLPVFLLATALFSLFFNADFCACASKGIIAELTDEYFEQGLLDYNNAVVLFYSQKCVHCSDFMPIFELAADELIRNEPPVHSAMVDCMDAGKQVCNTEEINHLPSIKIYRKGRLYDEYDGPRKVDDLVAYMKKLVGISSKELPLDNLQKFATSQKDVAVVAILRSKGNLRDNYFSLPAELSKDIRFGHVTVEESKMADLNITYGVTLYHPEHMRSKFEPWEYSYNIKNEGYDLEKFIFKNRYGLVGIRGIRQVDDFAPPLVIIYFRIDIHLKPKMLSYWRNRILKVAKNYQQSFRFAVSPIDDFQHEFVKFGIPMPDENNRDKPLVFAILENNIKYLMEEEFTMETFEAFLEGVLNKNIEAHLKSQPVPEETAEKGMVQTVVAKNFKSQVWGNEKNVLLAFYAPWCMFCKELNPILDKLAENLIEDNVDIFKMDGVENEIPSDFTIPRFPTLYYISKEDKHNPILYKGGANYQELFSFVKQHSSEKLNYRTEL